MHHKLWITFPFMGVSLCLLNFHPLSVRTGVLSPFAPHSISKYHRKRLKNNDALHSVHMVFSGSGKVFQINVSSATFSVSIAVLNSRVNSSSNLKVDLSVIELSFSQWLKRRMLSSSCLKIHWIMGEALQLINLATRHNRLLIRPCTYTVLMDRTH